MTDNHIHVRDETEVVSSKRQRMCNEPLPVHLFQEVFYLVLDYLPLPVTDLLAGLNHDIRTAVRRYDFHTSISAHIQRLRQNADFKVCFALIHDLSELKDSRLITNDAFLQYCAEIDLELTPNARMLAPMDDRGPSVHRKRNQPLHVREWLGQQLLLGRPVGAYWLKKRWDGTALQISWFSHFNRNARRTIYRRLHEQDLSFYSYIRKSALAGRDLDDVKMLCEMLTPTDDTGRTGLGCHIVIPEQRTTLTDPVIVSYVCKSMWLTGDVDLLPAVERVDPSMLEQLQLGQWFVERPRARCAPVTYVKLARLPCFQTRLCALLVEAAQPCDLQTRVALYAATAIRYFLRDIANFSTRLYYLEIAEVLDRAQLDNYLQDIPSDAEAMTPEESRIWSHFNAPTFDTHWRRSMRQSILKLDYLLLPKT